MKSTHLAALALILMSQGAHAADGQFYAGIGFERDRTESRVVPVLTFETGRFSIGLDEAAISLSDSDNLGADLGLSYDLEGNADVFARTSIYGAGPWFFGIDLGQSLTGEGSYVTPDAGITMSFGHVDIDLSAGVEIYDSDRSIAVYEQAGLPATTSPYVSLSAMIPLSETTAILGEVSAVAFDNALVTAGAVSEDIGVDLSIYLVREF